MIYRGKLVIIRTHNNAEITAHLTRDYLPGNDAHLSYEGRPITIPFWGIKNIEIVRVKLNTTIPRVP